MKIYQKLAVATAGVTLSFAAIETKPAQAATVTDDFTVNVTSGALTGQTGSGSFSYDDSILTGSGSETALVQSLSFNFLDKTYTQNDDYFTDFGFPTLDLNNGSVVGLNYTVNYSPNVIFYPADFGSVFSIAGTSNLYDSTGGATFYEGVPDSNDNLSVVGTVTYFAATPVPEPSSTWGTLAFGILSIGSLLLHQQKK
jgi:hypothetical protein